MMVLPPAAGGTTAVSAAPTSQPSPMPGPSTTPAFKPKPNTPSIPGTLNGPPSGNNHAIPLSARRAEALDLSTVERRGKPTQAEERSQQQNRLFGIPEAPTFKPTEEEFRDPMEYIRKVAADGAKYGIVKIIPPDTWNPPFAINTERFHFRTRRQELNSVEGGNRVNNDYLDQLAKFHKQNGHNLNRFPSVDKRPLDLYRLKKTVERKGGFEQVCKGKRWAEVGRDLGYSGKIMSSLSTSLKNSYQKWLLPYEEYLRLAKPGVQHQIEMMNGGPYTPSPGTSPAKKSQNNTPTAGMEDTPTMKATAALHSSINGGTPTQPPPSAQDISQIPPQPLPQPAPPTTGGFTPVNPSGFTAVNAAPAPAPTPPASFTSVNGFHPSNSATPPQPTDTPPISNGLQVQHIAPHPNGVAALKRQHSENILTPEEVDAMNRRSKRLRKDVPTVAGSNMHHSRMSAARFQPMKDRGNYKPGEICEGCGKTEDSMKFVVCQSCESAYHIYCLEPPLKQMPDYEWHCPRCLVGTNDYGFEEGDVYSLSGFQRKANEFKLHHFNTIPPQFSPFNEGKRHLDEIDVEREFWRLVENISDTTEVEYGADIHSTTHGSGFPTIEKQPRDPYSGDPWNLNILPLDKESLFRHIKSDISGMTVPWLYVGMVFSTFCWHNEDHFAYSANYQHFGQTKTWYGIPAEDTDKFEKAMKDEVPELFETQPDLLFQLVTLAKPDKLRKAGVRVFALDQRAGQFVITFPQAYHAGFNHGFNFNEAVNFAPNDWEPFGEEGVRRLRVYRKQPCFAHDELLLTAASRDHSIVTAKWLGPALERMRDAEIDARKVFMTPDQSSQDVPEGERYMGPRYEVQPDIIDPETEEEECICQFCKCYCYLSCYKCHKTGKYLCALHAGSYECCDALEFERYSGRDGTHRMYYRMTDDALNGIVQKVVDKANIPETWAAKVDTELEDNPRPSLKHLRTLLAEGEKIQYELPQLPDLRRFVERCNEWVEEATNYITRRQQSRRKSEKPWRKSTAKQAEQEEREKELRKVENINKLLAKADKISFDCAEITTLRERAEAIADFRRDAQIALNTVRDKTTAEFEELVERGRDFHVDMTEIDQLELLVKRLKWDDRARELKPNEGRQENTLETINDFIQQGMELGVPDLNQDMVFFREHKAQGELWEQKAKELMDVEQVHYQQLDSLSQQAVSLAVSQTTLDAVDAILKKQREVQEKIYSLVERSRNPDFRQRPMYREMKDVYDALEELQSKPGGTIDLEREQKRHEDWMRRGKKLFGKANAPLHILHQHMKTVQERNSYCFEITDKPRVPVEPASRQATPDDETIPIADGSNSSRDVFCICRKSEAGMMIECEVCHEWYHGKCLKIARGKVKEDDKYTCPICDYRIKIPRDAARPKLEDLQAWQDELETLPFQPEEEETLTLICDTAQDYREFIKPIIHADMPSTFEEVDTMRFHLRKIEGADLLLAEETNFLRAELHKWVPVAPNPPPHIDQSSSTRKPRPTKQQKLMARYGVSNPDDLPPQLKLKPHVAKRKASEANFQSQPSLQPSAGGESSSPPGSQLPSALPKSAGPDPTGSGKFYTALALHVLEDLARAPVVSEVLRVEPHMNRDKLSKMKMILQTDPSVWDNLAAFQQKMKETPTPATFTPSYSYSSAPGATATAFNGDMFQANDEENRGSQPPHLASPAAFNSPHPYPVTTQSPGPSFDAHMFDHAPGMFDSPSNEQKPAVTSPGAFGTTSQSMNMFESPKVGMHSPQGIGQAFDNAALQYPANIDNVFADLVNDHDTIGGLDGTSEVKGKDGQAEGPPTVVQSTEGPSGQVEEKGDVEMPDAVVQESAAPDQAIAPELQGNGPPSTTTETKDEDVSVFDG